jgi:fucose permease
MTVPALARLRWATAMTFAVSGLLVGSFASRIPALKSTLHLTDSVLGRTLFAIAIGSLGALQIAGAVVRRFGSRGGAWAGAMAVVGGLAITGATADLGVVIGGLFVYGAGNSLLDVSMNSQAVLIEHSYRRPIMSSFHAMFSAGALVGAALGALAAHIRLGQQLQYVVSAAVGLVLLVGAVAWMSPSDDFAFADDHAEIGDPATAPAPKHIGASRSRRVTIVLFGLVAFSAMLSEGAAADWSGVHLRDSLRWTESAAARGFVVFQLFMTIGRTVGDRVIAALGPRRTLIRASLLATIGFGTGLATHNGWMFVVGLGALGLGLSVMVPVVFSAAAAQPGDTGAAIAKVSTLGYAGFLVGPPFIGEIAQRSSTAWALVLLPVLCAAIALVTVVALPRRTSVSATLQRAQ